MPVAVSYPGVYIEEIPSGVRTITGVATSIAAFVDNFPSGPMNQAVQILSYSDFEKQFGGLDIRSEASYAIQQFFLNGGTEAYVVRVASTTANNGPTSAAIGIAADGTGGNALLVVTASSPGSWGNNVRVDVDYATLDPSTQFNLTVTEVSVTSGVTQIISTETFRNLVIDPTKPSDVAAVVNAGSQLITVAEGNGSAGKMPAQTGTIGGVAPDLTKLAKGDKLDISIGATSVGSTDGLPDPPPTTLAGVASFLQAQLRAKGAGKGLDNATVTVAGATTATSYLLAKTGSGKWADVLVISDSGTGLATKLGFAKAGQNVQQYALGQDASQAQVLPGGSKSPGSDGTWDPAGDGGGVAAGIIGDPNAKTGIYALLDVDLFNLLCLPVTANMPDTNAAAVASSAEALSTTRRAFYLFDIPQQAVSRDKVDTVQTWLNQNATLRSKNAALYFPRIDIPDPLNGFRLRASPPSGTIAGLYARIDGTRGVWKAPAGTEATLTNVQKLEYKLTDPENGVLNPLAINCLRNFPIYGPVCWGARTLNGADQMADEYKYIPVRRLALFLEESLYRGTQWVVFEPNDEPLWAQIRLNVGAFMHNLFRQGAFQGQTPSEAYFVKCDKESTTQNDIDLGIVNIIVGFAPLKPAEFVVIQIQQMAGQIAT
jgi:phage tail sheath protein FI